MYTQYSPPLTLVSALTYLSTPAATAIHFLPLLMQHPYPVVGTKRRKKLETEFSLFFFSLFFSPLNKDLIRGTLTSNFCLFESYAINIKPQVSLIWSMTAIMSPGRVDTPEEHRPGQEERGGRPSKPQHQTPRDHQGLAVEAGGGAPCW